MFSKYLAAIFLAAAFSVFAFADGYFYGTVTYTGEGCQNTMGDQVAIQLTSGGPIKYYYISTISIAVMNTLHIPKLFPQEIISCG
jgi:hypothetical protein